MQRVTLLNNKTMILKKDKTEIRKLVHHKDTTVGLWAIDRNPKEVSKEWIENNAFQIKY